MAKAQQSASADRRKSSYANAKKTVKNGSQRRGNIESFTYHKQHRRKVGRSRWIRYVLFFMVCFLAGFFFSQSPFFHVAEVNVAGNNAVSKELIIAASGIKIGDNIFAVSSKRASHWVKINYLIASAEIVKEYPDKITINIVERRPAALIPFSGGFLKIDKYGVVLEQMKSIDKADYPIFTGVNKFDSGTFPGTKILDEVIKQGLHILEQMPADGIDFIKEIDITDPQNIICYSTGNLEIRIGDSSDFLIKYNLARAFVDAEIDRKTINTVQYLDVSVIEVPVMLRYK